MDDVIDLNRHQADQAQSQPDDKNKVVKLQ